MPTPKHKGMRYHYVIGIDPGVLTGYAIKDTVKGTIHPLGSDTILAVQKIVLDWHYFTDIFVRIEDARKRKWIPKAKTESRERGRNQGAGSIKRDCQIWEEFLTTNKIPHEFVAPKDNKTKLDAKKFKQFTGYQGATNEHSRDAGALVMGY
jgi:hypothetical protein